MNKILFPQKLVVLTKFLSMYPVLNIIIYKGKEKKHMNKMKWAHLNNMNKIMLKK